MEENIEGWSFLEWPSFISTWAEIVSTQRKGVWVSALVQSYMWTGTAVKHWMSSERRPSCAFTKRHISGLDRFILQWKVWRVAYDFILQRAEGSAVMDHYNCEFFLTSLHLSCLRHRELVTESVPKKCTVPLWRRLRVLGSQDVQN